MMPKLRIAVIGVGASHGSRARQYIETITRLTEHYELARYLRPQSPRCFRR